MAGPDPAVKLGSTPTSFGRRVLEFVEQPLFMLAAGLLGGIVGVLFYVPVLVVCGICIGLAFHRAKVVAGKPLLRKQVPVYAGLFLVIVLSLYGVHVLVRQKLQEARDYGTLTEPTTLLSGDSFSNVEVGDSGVYLGVADPSGDGLRKLLGESHLDVKILDGKLLVSTDVRDASGKLLARLLKNEWQPAKQPAIFDRNYTKKDLEIIDDRGAVALQVRMVADHVQLQGKWYHSDGKQTTIMKSQNRPGYAVIHFAVTPAEQDDPMQPGGVEKIDPIFKYPSATHLGQLISSQNPSK
jgi:hypothetical protein